MYGSHYVCFISETWLNSRILSRFIGPDKYILVRKDRSDERTGGGVADPAYPEPDLLDHLSESCEQDPVVQE
jgi:hypothetical protein